MIRANAAVVALAVVILAVIVAVVLLVARYTQPQQGQFGGGPGGNPAQAHGQANFPQGNPGFVGRPGPPVAYPAAGGQAGPYQPQPAPVVTGVSVGRGGGTAVTVTSSPPQAACTPGLLVAVLGLVLSLVGLGGSTC
ncbi:MAG: hypothetical protein JO100_13940 [Pseudonocardia sp.]|nr:hypothetical protein [Pseudonocardia sp.]